MLIKPSKKDITEVNSRFSENALNMIKKRYLVTREDGTQESPAEMFARVADDLAKVEEEKYGKSRSEAKKIAEDFYQIMANKEYTPAGRTVRNAGVETSLVANCIVLPIDDSMDSIFQTLKDSALLQQLGSGLGFDFSKLRPAMFPTKRTQGVASGPVSFLKVYDAAFGTIKQQSRHGANIGYLRIDHPDVLDFVKSKEVEGDIRNFNISVSITDEFMKQLEDQPDSLWYCRWKGEKVKPRNVLRHPNGSVYGSEEADVTVKEIFSMLIEAAWNNGEPGIAFVDTWNKANPLPGLGELSATNPCVTGDTLVVTEKGLLRMKDIARDHENGELSVSVDRRLPVSSKVFHGINLRVMSNGEIDGEPVSHIEYRKQNGIGEVFRAWKTGVKPVYKLKTRSGYEIEATKDHKIFTSNGKVALGELKKGDKILVQSEEGLWSDNYDLPFEVVNETKGKNGRTYVNNFPKKWSEEIGWVLGWLVGDGWVCHKNNRQDVGFTFSREDKQIMEKIKPIVNRWRKLETREILRGNGVYHLTYRSRNFIAYLKNLGVKMSTAEGKEIPDSIRIAPREVVVSFLQALFSADGTIGIHKKNQTRYIRLTSKSEKLLKQVQVLLANFGIRTTVYNRSRKPAIKMGYRNDGILFELQISKTNIAVFLNKIGFIGSHYQRKAEILVCQEKEKRGYYQEKFEEEVESIIYSGEKTVYDLTEDFTHSFIANGVVISNCGEQALHPYDNCNLGSINLARFVKNKKVDFDRLGFVTRNAVRLMDNVIDRFDFPVDKVTKMAQSNRRVGLGVMGFSDMLYQMELRYDSKEGIKVAEETMGFINKEAYKASQELAKEKGEFPNWKESIFFNKGTYSLAQKHGIGKKMRNAALTTVAPTGSISMMLDTSSGIEPNFALAYIKQDKDGNKYRYFNTHFQKALDKLNVGEKKQKEVMDEVMDKGTIQHISSLPKKLRDVFVVAMDISGKAHMEMQAAFQRNVDNSISKTINFPNSATKEEIADSFVSAWKLGCKSSTVYRDGSRQVQILNVGKEDKIKSPVELSSQKASSLIKEPRPRPDVMVGKTYRSKTGYGNLYVTVNEDEKGNPFEVFAIIGKTGGFFQEQSEAICRLISLSLRSGVDVKEIIENIKGIRGPMPIFTDKGTVLSLPDALGKILEHHIGGGVEIEEAISKEENQETFPFAKTDKAMADYGFMPGCPDCGAKLIMEEGCINCKVCGFTRCM